MGSLERLLFTKLGLALRRRREPTHDEVELDRHRLFGPERAVIVKHGDSFLRRDVSRSPAVAGCLHELGDRACRVGVPPRWKSLLVHLEDQLPVVDLPDLLGQRVSAQGANGIQTAALGVSRLFGAPPTMR